MSIELAPHAANLAAKLPETNPHLCPASHSTELAEPLAAMENSVTVPDLGNSPPGRLGRLTEIGIGMAQLSARFLRFDSKGATGHPFRPRVLTRLKAVGGHSKKMGTLFLVRSGTTDFDEQDRIVGNLDIPVNVRGQAELTELARELSGQEIDTIYACDSESSRESARFLGEKLDVRSRNIEDLKNQDFGLWQGLQMEELRRKHPRVFKQWEESPCAICPPEGEMIESVMDRVRKGLKPVLKRAHQHNVVLIAPDPLRLVIRCHLSMSNLDQIWEHKPDKSWEAIPMN